jgi:predicted nucleic acid-binding Zn ribbon protein
MNTNLLSALKQIVLQYGGVEALSNAKRVKALLADLAAAEPKPQKNALIACLEHGFAAPLQNAPAHERGQVKAKLAERLNREEGLDPVLCADTLDLLEAALFVEGGTGAASPAEAPGPGKGFCTACGVALPVEARFCSACGAAVATGTKTDGPVCPACGTALPEKARFCYSCGATVAAEAVTTAKNAQDREVWRELRTLKGHTYRVQSVAYSPDGRRIVSGAMDNTIKIWDAEVWRELRTLKGHTLPVWSVAYSPDGCSIISGSYDKTIKIWDGECWR